jgi:hypothetical protein
MKTRLLAAAVAAGFLFGAPGVVLAQGGLSNAYGAPGAFSPSEFVQTDGYVAYGWARAVRTDRGKREPSGLSHAPMRQGTTGPAIYAPHFGR